MYRFVWSLCIGLNILFLADTGNSGEKRLLSTIIERSTRANQLGRPVDNSNKTVYLELDLYLIQILNLNEKNQVLTTNVWLTMFWNDTEAAWKKEDYEGVDRISIDKSLMWTPDIALYNYADERLSEQRNAMLVLSSNGAITWIPTAIYKSYCRIDITDFPFDEQFCFIKIGSWTYTERQLNISFKNQSRPMNLGDYTVSNEWDLIESPGRLFVSDYDSDRYPYLIYFLLLRRKSAFTACLLVLPCVLLASLTLVIFLLPPESPAKMVLGMNIFVAFFLLLLLLADNTPQASTSVPHLGIYFCMNMMLITLSSFLTVIVINSYFRGDNTNRVPGWILRFMIKIKALQPVPEFLQDDLSQYSSKRLSINRRKKVDQDGFNTNLIKKDENCLSQNYTPSQKSVVILENVKHKDASRTMKKSSVRRRDQDRGSMKEMNSNHNKQNTNFNGNLQSKEACHMFPGSCFCGDSHFFNDAYLMDQKPSMDGPFCGFCAQENYQTKMTHEIPYCPHELMNCSMCKMPHPQVMSSPPTINGVYQQNVSNFNGYPCPNVYRGFASGCNQPGQGRQATSDWENSLKEIQTSLKDFQAKIHKKEIAARISKEWRCVAKVLDRIFLGMYFIIQLLAVLFIIPRENKNIDERVLEFENEFFPQFGP